MIEKKLFSENQFYSFFLFLLSLSTIIFIKDNLFINFGKIFIYASLLIFLSFSLYYNKNNLFLILFICILYLLLIYLANFDVGEAPNNQFIKKIFQIFIVLFIFFYFFSRKKLINLDIFTISFILISAFLYLIIFLGLKSNFFSIDIIFSSFSKIEYFDLYSNNISFEYFFYNNPLTMISNLLIFYYLVQRKFNSRNISFIFILSILIFISDNNFSKFTNILIFTLFIFKELSFNLFKIFSYIILTLFALSTFLIIFNLQVLIDLIGYIYSFLSKIYFKTDLNFHKSIVVIYDEFNNFNYQIISVTSFEELYHRKYFDGLSSKFTPQEIRGYYYDIYFGIISRLIILKLKLSQIYINDFSFIINHPLNIKIIGGSIIDLKHYYYPDIVDNLIELEKKLSNNFFSYICANQKKIIDDCLINEISKDYEGLIFSIHDSNISQKIVSTHNSWLTLLLIFNKFVYLFIINIFCIMFYLLKKNKINYIFSIFSIFFIMLFEDYLFFNRYNISILTWVVISQCFILLSMDQNVKPINNNTKNWI